jgi:mono/diheme cytochrome c family protein
MTFDVALRRGSGLSPIALAIVISVLFCGLWGCDYGRMKEQEALRTYKTQIPEMPTGSVPVTGGLQVTRQANPEALRNPLAFNKDSVERGKTGYGYYCVMCHGSKADGDGTVGQSFYPLPTDLKSLYVQRQTDGRIFYTITFGLKRQPALGFMISEADRWAIIHYLRSLPGQQRG